MSNGVARKVVTGKKFKGQQNKIWKGEMEYTDAKNYTQGGDKH